MQLSIIIVSYNVKYFLEQCLAAVRLATRQLQAEVLVVDNNSPDDSVAYLQPLFPEVKFLAKAHNVGFAVANNSALEKCTGKYVLFLNPDTILAEDTLQQAIDFMEAHQHAGALGIRMLDGSGTFLPESKRGFPSPLTSLYKQVGLTRLFPRSKRFAKYYLGHLPEDQNCEADVLAGAFMLVRKQVLDTIGGFDEAFFMYGEDIDLSYRITQAGWKNYYFADSSIIHFKGESTSKASLTYVKVFYQAMQLFVQKHFRGNGALLYRMLLYAGIAGRGAVSAIGRLFHRQAHLAELPAEVKLHARGWPEHIAKPAAMLANDKRISIVWMPDEKEQDTDVLLVPGHTLSLKEAIAFVEQEGSRSNCWIHCVQTNSLVMSNNKNKAGIAAVFTS